MPTGKYTRKPGRVVRKVNVVERFLKYVSPEPMSGCWLWLAALSTQEYGVFSKDGKPQYAHRVSYDMFKGPIPEGLELDHLCRNTICVNPDHLEPVTAEENVRRGLGGILKISCPYGHPYDEINTYWRSPYKGHLNTSRQCRTCHREKERNRQREGKKKKCRSTVLPWFLTPLMNPAMS